MFNLPNLSSKALLLSGASLAALLLTAPAQATTLGGMTGRTFAQINMTTPPPRPAGFGGATTPDQAKQNTAQSSADFSSALARIQAQMSAQATARGVAIAGPNNLGADPNHPGQQLPDVPNGLGTGGLVAHANPSAADTANGLVWENANAPTQSTSGANTTVTVQQTAQKAILTWDSFNVGKNTTVHFDQTKGTQSDGSNNWIALNRVTDPTGVPSQILGNITAEGSVYLINRNGIVFGGSSQVNVHSVMVSTMDLFSSDAAKANEFFLKYGIGQVSDPDNIFGENQNLEGILVNGTDINGAGNRVPRDGIIVEDGASITAGAQGYVMLAAPDIQQGGSIIADDGEAFLASAGSVRYAPPATGGGAFSLVGVNVIPGKITNTGLIQTRRGAVQWLGSDMAQDGAVLASTSLSHQGSISFNDSSGPSVIEFGGNAITTVLPEKDGQTTTSSAAADAAFRHSSVTIGSVATVNSGTLIEVPSGSVTFTGSAYVDHDAIIDVSGLTDVELPMSAFMVTIPRIGQNELADSPLLRNGFLYTQQNVVIDSSQSGTRDDGLSWVGSPILNAAGYVENVPRTIDQLMISAGSISFFSGAIVRTSAQLRLDGGYINYLAGDITTPRLQGADGRIYDLASADPNIAYVGFAGEQTVNHDRWAITDTYNNTLLGSSTRFDPGFITGGDAGSLTFNGTNGQVVGGGLIILDGDISAHAYAGRDQVKNEQAPKGGSLGLGAQSLLGLDLVELPPGINFVIQDQNIPLEVSRPDFDATTPWPTSKGGDPTDTSDPFFWHTLSTQMIANAGIQRLTLDTGGTILVKDDATLAVTPGGSIAFSAPFIDVEGTLRAPSGHISLTTIGTAFSFGSDPGPHAFLKVGSHGRLDASGLWVNDTGQSPDGMIGRQFINGGSVSLIATEGGLSRGPDQTGNITLDPGSVVDVSSGGYVDFDGRLAMDGELPAGRGGDITIATHVHDAQRQSSYASAGPSANLDAGILVLDGDLLGYGFSGGGTLALHAAEIQIGGDPTPNDNFSLLYLDPSFFQKGGFADYALTSDIDALIAPGTTIDVHPAYRLPNWSALVAAPTGTDLNAAGLYSSIGDVADYQRYQSRGDASGFSLDTGIFTGWGIQPNQTGYEAYTQMSGSLTVGKGASIVTDPGASVELSATGSVIVLGEIHAPGGSIALNDRFVPGGAAIPDAPGRSLWLGDKSVLDASGISLIDPLAGPESAAWSPVRLLNGVVLDGGTVSLFSDRNLVAQEGAVVNVSGSSDVFDLPAVGDKSNIVSLAYQPTNVWSDAGSITIEASAGLFFDGSFEAHAGSPNGRGGKLEIMAPPPTVVTTPTTVAIELQQSGNLLPENSEPGAPVDPDRGSPDRILRFAVDRLNGSGIEDFQIGPTIDPSGSGLNDLTVPLLFSGDVNINLARSFTATTSTVGLIPAGTVGLPANGTLTGAGHVTISAPYVSLTGEATTASQIEGDGALNVQADFIDIGGKLVLAGIGDARFASSGDIRFTYPDFYLSGKPVTGWLYSTGNLDFTATRLYPVTDYSFMIDSNGGTDASGNARGTTVEFHGNGQTDESTPLSAGGTLVVAGSHIEQGGTLWVPSGSLVLGIDDPDAIRDQLGVDNSVTLAKTQSVELLSGSVTSVSLNGAVVPYGTTVDGKDWNYNGDPTQNSPAVEVPPSKQIAISGQDIALDAGATIDLSGGGHLQASEWVPGTGGSRDVLSQSAINYTDSNSGTQAPLYADGRPIYAILPGYHAPVSAHDSALEKGAGDGPSVGQGVYLSGIPGLADGVYTLLPARYATMPGAYRVVQGTGPQDPLVGRDHIVPDGTNVVGGYFVDTLTGARDARASLFQVQSAASWGQYSEYDLTSADTFFAASAAHAGNVTPQLGMDAGRLSLAATSAVTLNTVLTAKPGPGGRGAEVDIAGDAIQIASPGQEAHDGYLLLDADGLSNLGASSLLIGGKRVSTAEGEQVDALAGSVLLSNDADHPLQGPEVILVTNASGDGITLLSGSVLRANGAIDSATSVPLIIGAAASGENPATSGDGTLVRVSNGAVAPITRRDVTGIDGAAGTAGGALTIQSGALLDGGQSLSIDVTGPAQVASDATFIAKALDITANRIGVVADPGSIVADSFLIGPSTLSQLSGAVTLRSRTSIDFLGDVALTVPDALILSATSLGSDGGNVLITADTLTLSNDLGGVAPTPMSGSGSLVITVGELDFAGGVSGLSGFDKLAANATRGIVVLGTGDFDFGALNVNMTAPRIYAATEADMTLHTSGNFDLARGGTTSTTPRTLGGGLAIQAGTIDIGADIVAPGGSITLRTTGGDLNIGNGAIVDVAGVTKTFDDTAAYLPGGTLTLDAQAGNIVLASDAMLDLHGDASGGNAGRLTIDAEAGSAQLNGRILGSAANGYLGGTLQFDTAGAVDLNALADILAAGGVNGMISIRTGSGDLALDSGHTLTAYAVDLAADGNDGGHVNIGGTIDASGSSGGNITLDGRWGINIEGALLTNATASGEKGGDISIATNGIGDGNYNFDHGYEEILSAGSGTIHIGASARIDQSGPAGSGDLSLRLPVLQGGDINLVIDSGADFSRTGSVTVEPYAIWSTTDTTSGAQHFDSIIDPAGWFKADGTMVNGSWTDQQGNPLSPPTGADELKAYLAINFFTPDTAQANTDHQTFYGYLNGDAAQGAGTVMGYIQSPGFSFESRLSGIANLRVRPGVELRNPDPTINGGDISVLTSWNLGAGTDLSHLAFRYNGQAPIITLRAENDLEIKASLTDGFWQTGVLSGAGTIPLSNFDDANGAWTSTFSGFFDTLISLGIDPTGVFSAPVGGLSGDQTAIEQYYGLYQQYLDFLNTQGGNLGPQYGQAGGVFIDTVISIFFLGSYSNEPTPPTPPVVAADYPAYLKAYKTYFATVESNAGTLGVFPDNFAPIVAPPPTLDIVPADPPVNNSPSLSGNTENQLPIATATLAGGNSSSYRLVAGADFTSTNPLAVRKDTTSGKVVLDGHMDYADTDTGLVLHTPNVIRTGTGDIDIAAASDIRWEDDVAPTAIYAAGAPADGTSIGSAAKVLRPSENSGLFQNNSPELVVTDSVNPDNGGNISLHSGGDILGIQEMVDKDGSATGLIGASTAQYWWEWMQTNNTESRSSINFGGFDQGVMSVGGNVNVDAAGDIRQLSVSLPTTWVVDTGADGTQSVRTIGGGDMNVRAGGDILSGTYFVARGLGNISAGGDIGADFSRTDITSKSGIHYPLDPTRPPPGSVTPDATGTEVATILALQDTRMQVQAGKSVDIGGVFNPSWLDAGGLDILVSGHADGQSYSANSSLSVQALRGDLNYGSLISPTSLFTAGLFSNVGGTENANAGVVLPATINFTAVNGDLNLLAPGELYPSATGNLTFLADASIHFDRPADNHTFYGWGLIDAPPSLLPSPLNTVAFTDPSSAAANFGNGGYLYTQATSGENAQLLHAADPLHGDDNDPVRIYALNGDIVNGIGGGMEGYYFVSPKPARIEAGRDIVDLAYLGQQVHASDISLIEAGRDIIDTPLSISLNYDLFGVFHNEPVLPVIAQGGPGNLIVNAGRDIGPLSSQTEFFDLQPATSGRYRTLSGDGGALTGIDTVGNAFNPYLPSEGANIQVLYGVGPGIATSDFIAKYIDPASSAPGVPNFTDDLVGFVESYEGGLKVDTGSAFDKINPVLTADQAWGIFNTLPDEAKSLFVQKSLFKILAEVGRDYNDPSSPFAGKYERGYTALNTLFPASLGYTANGLSGGTNGAEKTIDTGDLDIRGSTIQTQQGGDIGILAPGGEALLGSAGAPPLLVGTIGNVVAGPNTMGVLTFQEGDVDIFTDRSVLLAQSRIFTEQGGNMVIWSSNGDINAGKGAKTTTEVPPVTYLCNPDAWCALNPAGEISGAGIATLQSIPGALPGSVYLLAPRGTVDAGDAGIRVSGDLFIAALSVANADNIQVQGKAVGLPPRPVTNLTLTTASTAATEAAAIANNVRAKQPTADVEVEVTGYGGTDSEHPVRCIPGGDSQCSSSSH